MKSGVAEKSLAQFSASSGPLTKSLVFKFQLHCLAMEEIPITVRFWPSLRAFVLLSPGPRPSTKKALWVLWLLLTVGILFQHQNRQELLWPVGILVLALSWRWWFLLPILSIKAWGGWPDGEITYRLVLIGDTVVASFRTESLILKSPAFSRKNVGDRIIVFATDGGIPFLTIPKDRIPLTWLEKLQSQLAEKELTSWQTTR